MKKVISEVYHFVHGASEHDLASNAAATAFFTLLSFVPILTVVSSILPYTAVTKDMVVEIISAVFPQVTESFFASLIEYIYDTNAGVISFSVVIAVWSAGKGMLSLIRGMNEIYHDREERGYLKLRLISSLYMAILLVAILLVLVVGVFGQSIIHFLFADFPLILEAFEHFLSYRFLLSIILLGVVFTLMYTYLPNRKMQLKKQLLPGFLAAACCTVFSYGFSIYVDYFNDFSYYGSLSIIIIIMFWLYFTMYIVLYGAYLSRVMNGEGDFNECG
ncbi:MAG: YihY/virulence factor BrkB family protein [Lachnospiraceae bacterium]|nr:YihY/virulence factor BrkB family protein [Lachnospiraceae bacterium]